MKTSFGEYFDKQRDKIVQDMQTGKNTELYNAWREDYDKRHGLLSNAVRKGIDAKENIDE